MNINSSLRINQPNFQTTSMVKSEVAPQESNPQETFTFGGDDKAGFAALGAGIGAVTVGATAGLGMGAAKAFMNGSPLLGTAMAAGTVVAAGTAFFGFGTAVMSSTSGTNAGVYGFLGGGALATAGAACAIF